MTALSMETLNKLLAATLAEESEWMADNPPLYLHILYGYGEDYEKAVQSYREFHLAHAAAMRKRAS